MAASRTPARRRQRSVRVTVAVSLLSVATAAVLLALPTQSPLLLSVSSVTAIVLGWAALRIVWTEVLQSRRENALDRAAAATAYKELFSVRAAEHAEFTTAMTERLAEANLSQRELQGELVQAQQQAAEARLRAETAESGLVDAIGRVAELQDALQRREAAEHEAALAAWEGEGGESVQELVAWAEQAAHRSAENDAVKAASTKGSRTA
ncbi:MAG TPA: hypothetical protein VFK34_05170 [Marmoricola sp.]|jgi:hypothetical protein|nr:hypothetical protein [Marmoricola sp.]